MQRFPSFGEIHLPSHVMNRLSPDSLKTFSWAGPLLPNFSRVMPFCIGPKSKSSFLDVLRARSSCLRDLSIQKLSTPRLTSRINWSDIVQFASQLPDNAGADVQIFEELIANLTNAVGVPLSWLAWPKTFIQHSITKFSQNEILKLRSEIQVPHEKYVHFSWELWVMAVMTTGSILHASFCDFAISAMSTVTMKQSYRVSQCHQAEMRIYDSIFPPTQFKFKKFIFLTLLSTTT